MTFKMFLKLLTAKGLDKVEDWMVAKIASLQGAKYDKYNAMYEKAQAKLNVLQVTTNKVTRKLDGIKEELSKLKC